MLKHTRLSVVSRGPKGCTARSASGETAAAPADDVKVVDTIGAGDFFTAGFLTAYLQVRVNSAMPSWAVGCGCCLLPNGSGANWLHVLQTCSDGRRHLSCRTAYVQGAPLQRCAEAGCATGAQAVQVSGAELSSETWARLRAEISALVAPSRQAVWNRWIDPRGWAGMSGVKATTLCAALPLLILGLGVLASRLSRKA